MFPAPGHDHRACIDSALKKAERICKQQHLRLTPIRRRVFGLVWRSHRPVTAYALLEQLVREGHRAQAPTVYRSLEFLMSCGLVHRVESMNAFVGCNRPRHGEDVDLLICESCGEVAELPDSGIPGPVARSADRAGFIVHARMLEVRGICGACAQRGSGD
jgi:Fur family zinc uptake transcriptional regulator